MAVPTTNPNPTPPTLTTAQTRALLHNLLSTTPNAHRPTSASPRPATVKAVRQQPVQQNITIDVSTRIMGHCNNVALASPSSTKQVHKIEQSFCGMFQPIGQGEEKTTEKKTVNLNVVIQAGVSIIGSKNVIVFNGNGKRGVSEDDTKVDAPSAERKRKAESKGQQEPEGIQTTVAKKVKVEE